MPILDGFTAAKEIKNIIKTDGLLDVKIIGNSGLFLEEDI